MATRAATPAGGHSSLDLHRTDMNGEAEGRTSGATPPAGRTDPRLGPASRMVSFPETTKRALEGRSSGSRISRSALPSQPLFFPPFPPPGEALSRRAAHRIERLCRAADQWPKRRSSPVTATGSRRIFTDFPRRAVRTRAPDRRPPHLAVRGSPSTVMSCPLFTPPTARTSSAPHCRSAGSPVRCSTHQVLVEVLDRGCDLRRGKCGAPAAPGLRGIPPRTRRRNGSASGHFATAASQRGPREGDRKPATRAGRPA